MGEREAPTPDVQDSAPVTESPELIEARAKAQEHWEALLRARAELENARRRHERELQNAVRYGTETLVANLLPVRDSLAEALRLSEQAEGADALTHFAEGTRLTLGLLDKALEQAGLTEVPTAGRFDPAHHQAMATRETDDAADGDVLEVVQKGYRLADRLVRPAMVIVARAQA